MGKDDVSVGLFIGVIVVAVVVVGAVIAGFLGVLFKSSLKAGKDDARAASKLPSLAAEDAEKLTAARKSITSTRQLALRVQDEAIKEQAQDVLGRAEGIVSSMKGQPDEIRRAKQFFGYYLPTLNTVLKTYRELESGGMQSEEQKKQVLAFLDDASRAFQALYENMFKDEKLDLEVETEAMQAALRRDGLIGPAERSTNHDLQDRDEERRM